MGAKVFVTMETNFFKMHFNTICRGINHCDLSHRARANRMKPKPQKVSERNLVLRRKTQPMIMDGADRGLSTKSHFFVMGLWRKPGGSLGEVRQRTGIYGRGKNAACTAETVNMMSKFVNV